MATEQVDFASAHGLPTPNFSASAVALSTLKKAGIVGDVVELAIVATMVTALYNEGRIDEAKDLLASSAASFAGGTAGGIGGAALALATLAIITPEPGTTLAGLTLIFGAVVGGVGGAALGEGIYNALMDRLSSGGELTDQDFIDIIKSADGNCFLASTPITMSDGTTKSIEDIRVGDKVMSYDPNGPLDAPLTSKTVTELFRNEVTHILDVHGLMVTPGHVTLCGDGPHKGRHVPMIDILCSDGALVQADGALVRVATNARVGSTEDAFVKLAYALTSKDAKNGHLHAGEIRVGTLSYA